MSVVLCCVVCVRGGTKSPGDVVVNAVSSVVALVHDNVFLLQCVRGVCVQGMHTRDGIVTQI